MLIITTKRKITPALFWNPLENKKAEMIVSVNETFKLFNAIINTISFFAPSLSICAKRENFNMFLKNFFKFILYININYIRFAHIINIYIVYFSFLYIYIIYIIFIFISLINYINSFLSLRSFKQLI